MTNHNKSIYETFTAKLTVNNAQLAEIVNFIMTNTDVRLSMAQSGDLVKVKPLIPTPISEVFSRAVDLGKDRLFSFINIPKAIVTIPEVITYTHLTYDFKQLEPVAKNLYDVIHHLPNYSDTILSNVTTILKSRTNELSDSQAFQANCVRDLLSRSYYTNTSSLWLTPSIIRYLCRCYNMSIGIAVAGLYGLTYQEQSIISTVFAYYFMHQVTSSSDAEAFIKSNKLGLPPVAEIDGILNRFKELVGDKYTDLGLDDVCDNLPKMGFQRMVAFNRKVLYTRTKNLGPDLYTSTMAIEYPPYWAYLVLLSQSGRKIGLYERIKNTSTLHSDVKEYCNDLLKTHSFLQALK